MTPTLPYLCGLAAAMFVAVGLAMAAVRWFHLCRPYDRHPDYYYPGRPFIVGVYLCVLLLVPYVLHPESPDAWYLARLYFFPVILCHFCIFLYSYFGSVMQWRKWRVPILILVTPVALALLVAFGLAIVPGDQISGEAIRIANFILYLLGSIQTLSCLALMVIVLRWAQKFDEDDFSNPADFPVVFARRWSVMILANMVMCWVGALANSPALLAVVMLLYAASKVIFIISALHPHRNGPVGEDATPEDESVADAQGRPTSFSRNRDQEILAAIRIVVEDQQAYLDSHLTLQDVADRCGYSRTTISALVKSEYGGFFAYVNRLRLQHMDAYQRQYPGASLQEAVEESGFRSRQAYYNVKARLDVIASSDSGN